MRNAILRFGRWLRRSLHLTAVTPAVAVESVVDEVPTAEQVDDEKDDLMLAIFNLGHEAGWKDRGEDDDRRRGARIEHEREQLLKVLASYARPAGRFP